MYTEKSAAGLYQPHLWMGATELLFATWTTPPSAPWPTRAPRRNSPTCAAWSWPARPAASSPTGAPNLDYFRRLDERVRYLNEKGIIADLILAGGAGTLTKLFPTPDERRRFVRFLVARYAAMNVTWQGVDHFEDYPDGRALLKEIGGYLKELDPYQHPRTTGARITSTPLLDDGWMDFAATRTPDDPNVGADRTPALRRAVRERERRRAGATPRGRSASACGMPPWTASTSRTRESRRTPRSAKAMTVWFDFLADTRYWELEPYFDVDGGRAVALEDTEYVVYIEKPGPLELTVEKHGYDVYWINPATGESTSGKKFSGEHFTGEPPDSSHDWVLHVVREGRVEGMNKSYKFESREIVLQEVESNSAKVPFAIEQPRRELSMSKPLALRGEDHARDARHAVDDVAVDGRRGRRSSGLPRARHRPEGRNEAARRTSRRIFPRPCTCGCTE